MIEDYTTNTNTKKLSLLGFFCIIIIYLIDAKMLSIGL